MGHIRQGNTAAYLLPCHPEKQLRQALITAAEGADRRSAKNADRPKHQSREALLAAWPLRSPEGSLYTRRRQGFSRPVAVDLGCGCCRGGRGPQPQRRLGRLHGLVDHGAQLGREGGQIDVVAEAGAERLDGPGRVVVSPVEAPVHRLLDAATSRLEHRGHGQGGGGDDQAGSFATPPNSCPSARTTPAYPRPRITVRSP